VLSANVAVQLLAAVIVTVVGLVLPLQSPFQPVKVEPVAGVAVRVTVVPAANAALQVAPHVIPAALLVTVPVPVPALDTVRVYEETSANVAVQLLSAVIVTVVGLLLLLLQLPLQPLKVEPVAGVAARVTVAPDVKVALQVLPHVIPAGLLVTVPVPAPALLTVRASGDSVGDSAET
jgi:hypothetical protein